MTKRGFSLIEILVVIGVFSLIAIVVSQSISSTLVGSRKSDATATVREELNHAVSVAERHLRSAKSVTGCSGAASDTISYIDQNGNAASFTCSDNTSCTDSSVSYVASGSARITSSAVCITNCQFTCTQPSSSPASIEILMQGQSKGGSGAEDAVIEVKTTVTLRAY